MDKYFLLIIIIAIFLLGCLFIGYQWVENQQYEAYSECYQNLVFRSDTFTNNNPALNDEICDLILHKIGIDFEDIKNQFMKN